MRRRLPTDPRQPRWQRRPHARPDEILDAAQAVFGECGFARTRLEEVARRAGVSKGTLYLYFESKEALFREMVRAKLVRVVAEGEAIAAAHEGSWRDLLTRLLDRGYRVVRDPATAKIIRLVQAELGGFPELAQFYFDEVILRMRRLLAGVLERGVAAGEFRPVAFGFAARGLLSVIVNTAQLQSLFPHCDPDALDDEEALTGLIDFCLQGVLAHPDARL